MSNMKAMSKFCATLFIIFLKIEWSTEDLQTRVLEEILQYQPSRIKTLIHPKIKEHSNETVKVYVSMLIRTIEDIDDINMEMKIQARLHMSWVDPRLSYQHLSENKIESAEMIRLKDTSNIWIPDIFFINEKQFHGQKLIEPNSFIEIAPNGTVLYSKRISLTLSCPMNLKNYPHDSQICSIRLSTYHSTTKHVILLWKSDYSVQVSRNLHVAKFTLNKIETSEDAAKTNTGEYSSLLVDLYLERQFFHHFKKNYLPVFIIVLLSWIPLWLERVLILRIYIALSTLISLGWFYTVQDDGLLISYNTAINSWNAGNFIFVLLVAIESMGIVFMIKTNTNAIKRVHPDDNDEFKMFPYGPDKRKVLEIVDEKPNLDVEITKIKTNFKICFINVHKEVQIIDAAAKLFFPSAYVLFLFFYWITYY